MFEISTDKVDAEIPAPSAGVLAEILVKEGETVAVQTVVARLETDASAAAAPAGSDVRGTRPGAGSASRPGRRGSGSAGPAAPARPAGSAAPGRPSLGPSPPATSRSKTGSGVGPLPWSDGWWPSTGSISVRFPAAGWPAGSPRTTS